MLLLTASKPELLDKDGDRTLRGLLYDFFAFGRSLEAARAKFASYVDLSPTQYLIMIALKNSTLDEPMGINQVAARLRLSGAFITNEVNKLVSDGLLEKSTHPSDGRRVQLTVTESGFQSADATRRPSAPRQRCAVRNAHARRIQIVVPVARPSRRRWRSRCHACRAFRSVNRAGTSSGCCISSQETEGAPKEGPPAVTRRRPFNGRRPARSRRCNHAYEHLCRRLQLQDCFLIIEFARSERASPCNS